MIIEPCKANYFVWPDEVKESIRNTTDCGELGEIEEIKMSLIPEFGEPEMKKAENDCDLACVN